MHCPFCSHPETKVIDSRLAGEGLQVRRRRECLACAERFTTFETAELVMPRVIKRDDTREPFDDGKLRSGMVRALEILTVGQVGGGAGLVTMMNNALVATNGTYINDELIDEYLLRDGDFIKVGRCIFKFLSGSNIENAYHEEIYRLTTIDGLTQIYNKRYFQETLEREIKLRFRSAGEARVKLLALGATPLRGRRLQEDALLDFEDDLVAAAGLPAPVDEPLVHVADGVPVWVGRLRGWADPPRKTTRGPPCGGPPAVRRSGGGQAA